MVDIDAMVASGSLTIEADWPGAFIETDVADPSWEELDAKGHTHRFVFDRKEGASYLNAHVLTAKWVKTGRTYYDDGEYSDIHELKCLKCRAVLHPKRMRDSVFIRDRVPYYYANGERITEAEYNQSVERIKLLYPAKRDATK